MGETEWHQTKGYKVGNTNLLVITVSGSLDLEVMFFKIALAILNPSHSVYILESAFQITHIDTHIDTHIYTHTMAMIAVEIALII